MNRINILDKILNVDFFKAVEANDISIVKIYVKAGIDINTYNSSNLLNPLHICSIKEYTMMANFLIENNADVNIRSLSGRTPLIIAAYNSCPDIVKILVDARADTTIRDNYNYTALDYAKSSLSVKAKLIVDILTI